MRQYSYTLLDKLQPHFKQAVLALKASGQLKDPEKISWDSVVSFITTQERSEQRLAGTDGERNMAARRQGKPSYRDSVGAVPTPVATPARLPSAPPPRPARRGGVLTCCFPSILVCSYATFCGLYVFPFHRVV